MSIHVYQLKELTEKNKESVLDVKFYGSVPKAIALIKSGDYNLVATVDTDSLEKAFERTNSIDSYWGENTDVTDYTTGSRSSSVGDVFVKDNKAFIIKGVGFEELSIEVLDFLPNPPLSKKNKP